MNLNVTIDQIREYGINNGVVFSFPLDGVCLEIHLFVTYLSCKDKRSKSINSLSLSGIRFFSRLGKIDHFSSPTKVAYSDSQYYFLLAASIF